MLVFPQSVIGCPLRSSYAVSKNPALQKTASLRGHGRFELKDTNTVHLIDMLFEMSASQFNSWQGFWASIGRGTDWFVMDTVLGQGMDVHATGPFSATSIPNALWRVTLQVEVVG